MQEIFGLTDHIRRVADRFAAGFDALSPNLFTREGEPPSMEAGMDKLKAFVGRTPDAQILGDLNAAAAFLRGAGQARGTIGLVGYCWGGRFAMLAAAELEALDAAVAYYGRITGEATINQPRHPLGLAARMRAPLQGHFGGKDASIALDDVRRLEQDVRQGGGIAELHVYPEAGHAFNNDTRPDMYHPEVAALAMERSLAWFRDYLA